MASKDIVHPVTIAVVDTGAFVKRTNLDKFVGNIWTVEEVLGEVRDSNSREYLESFPHSITTRLPSPTALRAVISFSSKTGDLHFLSKTDLKLMALAYDMTAQYCGSKHLRTTPRIPQIQNNIRQKKSSTKPPSQTQGSQPLPQVQSSTVAPEEDDFILVTHKKKKAFKGNPQLPQQRNPRASSLSYATPSSSSQPQSVQSLPNPDVSSNLLSNEGTSESNLSQPDQHESQEISKEQEKESQSAEESSDHDLNDSEMQNLTAIPTISLNAEEQHFLEKVLDTSGDLEQSSLEAILSTHISSKCKSVADVRIISDLQKQQNDDDSEDDGTWITPENVNTIFMGFEQEKVQQPKNTVIVFTGDFTIQNVLMQIGIQVASVENGQMIRFTKSFVRRCLACSNIVRDHERKFCPKCGYSNLARISYTVDKKGNVRYGILKRPPNLRGTRYSIPKYRGGRDGNNLILTEDEYLRKMGRRKKKEKDIMDDLDYTFGEKKEQKTVVIGYGKKNPNEGRKRTGKRKKNRSQNN